MRLASDDFAVSAANAPLLCAAFGSPAEIDRKSIYETPGTGAVAEILKEYGVPESSFP